MTDQTTNPTEDTTEVEYTGIVVEYSPVDAALAELRQRYADVIFPVQTKDGMKDAKEVRSKLTKLRTGLEAKRKEIKEPALRRAQAIDAEAKAITAAIKAIEEPIDAQIKAEEARIEAEKAAKAAKLAEIQGKIDGIRNLPLAVAGCTSDEIAAERDALDAFEPLEEVFGELLTDCIEAKRECILALCDLYDRVLKQELAAEAVKAEAERVAQVEREAAAKLAAEREAFEAEKAAYEAEKRAFEAAKAAAAAPVAAPSGAESEPVEMEVGKIDGVLINDANGRQFEVVLDTVTEVMPVAEVTAEEAAQVFTEAAPEAPVFVAEFHIRQLAMATADQFHALSGKVEQCGFTEFADTLRAAGNHLHAGAYDAALTKADHEALIAADNLMLDATIAAIDALGDEAIAA